MNRQPLPCVPKELSRVLAWESAVDDACRRLDVAIVLGLRDEREYARFHLLNLALGNPNR